MNTFYLENFFYFILWPNGMCWNISCVQLTHQVDLFFSCQKFIEWNVFFSDRLSLDYMYDVHADDQYHHRDCDVDKCSREGGNRMSAGTKTPPHIALLSAVTDLCERATFQTINNSQLLCQRTITVDLKHKRWIATTSKNSNWIL